MVTILSIVKVSKAIFQARLATDQIMFRGRDGRCTHFTINIFSNISKVGKHGIRTGEVPLTNPRFSTTTPTSLPFTKENNKPTSSLSLFNCDWKMLYIYNQL